MASALTTFDSMLKELYSDAGAAVMVCAVCTSRSDAAAPPWLPVGKRPVYYSDLGAHCREHDDPEHLAMLVMES